MAMKEGRCIVVGKSRTGREGEIVAKVEAGCLIGRVVLKQTCRKKASGVLELRGA